MKTKFILFFIILLFGCTPHVNMVTKDPFVKIYYISDKFNYEEKNSIIKALHTWKLTTQLYLEINISSNSSKYNCYIDKYDGDYFDENDKDDYKYTIGFCDDKCNIYLITKNIEHLIETDTDTYKDRNKLYYELALHEIGHSLKMNHTLKMGSIMYPYIDYTADCITLADIKEFCKIYNCNPKDLNYCEYPSLFIGDNHD